MRYQQKWLLCFYILFLLLGTVAGQTGDINNLKNIVPPSPNASALGKYGEWPVSLYTGVPNINIPVYELKGRSVSVPVSLSYHAAGNKVGEIASWVGLGWSLNSGGLISRSVKGIPDDESDVGYFAKRQLYSNPESLASYATESVWKTHAYEAANNNADGEPDLYTVNVMGRSYKLLFKGDGSILTMPHSNLKITTNAYTNAISPDSARWTIILEDGTVCNFGGPGCIETNTNPRFGNLVGSSSYTSSWFLKSIKSATGEVINFTYTTSLIDQDSYFSENDLIKFSTSTGTISTCTQITETGVVHKAEKQQVTVLNLSSIESDLAKIDFVLNTGERLDLKGGKRLDSIKIFSKFKGEYVERYVFNYTYSQAVTSNELLSGISTADTSYYRYRLRLNSLEKKDNSGATSQNWSFAYNSQNLPSRRSYAQDHWGFYNGALTNTTLLPPYHYSLPNTYFTTNDNTHGFFPPMHELGANRNGNEASMKAEILTDIIYPTGGKTTFDYEANSSSVIETQFADATISTSLHLTSLTSPYNKFVEVPFTVKKGQYVQFTMTSYISPGIFNDNPGASASAQIICVDGGCINGAALTGNQSGWFNLRQPGNYKLKVFTNVDQTSFGSTDAIDISASLVYKDSTGVLSYNKPVGGLRVKSILNYDFAGASATSKKYFLYDSALIISPIDTTADYITEQVENNCTDYGASGIEMCSYQLVRRNSSTKFALGSIQGGTVGYGKVTTLYGSTGENGKTISLFTSVPDVNADLSKIFPYPSTESREWRRGLLLKETHFNSLGAPIDETENTYQFTPIKSLTAFKAGYHTINGGAMGGTSPCSCTDPYQFCNIQQTFYLISTEQVKLISAKKTSFDGSRTLAANTNYFYDNANNLQATRTETVNSKGDSIKNITRTALEKADINAATTLTSTASTAIDSMLQRNIINLPIQQEKYVNNVLVSRSLINYKNWGAFLVLPENVQIQKGANTIESRIQFSAYDAYGNLLEQAKENDTRQSYLYDYANTYPVAQVINASYGSLAFTSFESDGQGNWDYVKSGDTSSFGSVTGNKAYLLSMANIQRTGLANSQTYVITYWLKDGSGSVSINGGTGGTSLYNKNGWTLYQLEITGSTSATLSGTGIIDELRLYPKNAQMNTYTYDPLIGLTSSCDANNKITYYEYDSFNRLLRIRDHDKNIIKAFKYTYQEAQ